MSAQCPVCCQDMHNDEILCDKCEEPVETTNFAVVGGPGGTFVYHIGCYDGLYHDCVQGEDADKIPDTFDVPYAVQSWLFEALIELEIDHLHEIIDDHHDEIVEMARKRHREGHVVHGSKGYQWDAKTRLRNVLEELSDAPTYLTMGPIE